MAYRRINILFILAIFFSCGIGAIHYFKTEKDRLLCETYCKQTYGKSIISAIAQPIGKNTIYCSCYRVKGFPLSLEIEKNQEGCEPVKEMLK